MPRLRFTRAAESDLADIRAYIARDNPAVAKSFVETIVALCGNLAATPQMGSPRPDLGAGIRLLVARRHYAVLYRIGENDVHVIRVIHTARDIRRLLGTPAPGDPG